MGGPTEPERERKGIQQSSAVLPGGVASRPPTLACHLFFVSGSMLPIALGSAALQRASCHDQTWHQARGGGEAREVRVDPFGSSPAFRHRICTGSILEHLLR